MSFVNINKNLKNIQYNYLIFKNIYISDIPSLNNKDLP